MHTIHKRTIIYLVILFACFIQNIQAKEAESPIVSSVVITKPQHNLPGALPDRKEVYLMPVKLTTKQKEALIGPKITSTIKTIGLPNKVSVGMNNVPVLDQGKHGSCVTFAITGALDALIGKGDYVSQLCSLELGSYLETRGYLPSGWNGSNGFIVLNQIQQYGIVNKENQKNKSCGGVFEYPTQDRNSIGNPMSLDEFKSMSENMINGEYAFYWEPSLTFFQRFFWQSEKLESEKVLMNVKKFLADKENADVARLTFGIFLPVSHCSAGACASYHATDDTWALTDAIKSDKSPDFCGHEMVITGYDDNAVAIDNAGMKHQGLLFLRNSWGDNVGDHGNYYMTYDFFKAYVMDIQKIYLVK